MRGMLGVAALAVGCTGDAIDVDPVPFLDAAAPAALVADLPPHAVDAHEAAVTVWGVVGLMTTDPNVRDLMAIHGGLTRADTPLCWSSGLQGITASVDFGGCPGILGGATVKDTPVGPLVVEVGPSFDYQGRRFTGGIGLDAVPEVPYVWAVSSVSSGGQPADAVTVDLGGRQVQLNPAGYLALDRATGRIQQWGGHTVSTDQGQATVRWGWVDELPAANPMAPSPPPDAPAIPPWPGCACATAGAIELSTQLAVTEVQVDLSRALDTTGTQWPILSVPVTQDLPGRLVLRAGSECGRWNASFEADPDTQLVVPADGLRAAVDLGCDRGAFRSDEDCEGARLGAASAGPLQLQLDAPLLNAMAAELVGRQLEADFCRL